ncbi:MAG TPA: hypothetical protein VGM59_15025 [Dongiaceae bacterium]|jgi:hypothetical protein
MSGDRPPPDHFDPKGGGSPSEVEFDDALAESYVGRTIIIGLTYLDHAGNLLEQRQLHGEIVSATREGIEVTLGGKYAGQIWNMPPALENIQHARAGEYRFRETGEVVVDPDLMATWKITKPTQN